MDASDNISEATVSDTVDITQAGDAPPVVSSFDIPSTSDTLTVTILAFNATDDNGVAGYMVTESASAPNPGSGGWSGSAPGNYTFSGEGTKTLYAWAKDTAEQVSASASDTVTITLASDNPPVVTSFDIPATSSSLTVSILSFNATDDNGVDGYMVTESATPPSPGSGGWNATPPGSYTFSGEGTKTLYGWAKDTIGQVSSGLGDTVNVTLAADADTLDGLDSTDFALSDHNHDGIYQKLYNNVFIVSTDGNGDYTSIQEAIDAVSPSVTDRYIIDIKPGTYTESVTMKSYIHLQGSGSDLTVIQSDSISNYTVHLNNVNDVTISDLTLTGGARGVLSENSHNITIRDNEVTGNSSGIEANLSEPGSTTIVRNAVSGNDYDGIACTGNPGASTHDCYIHANSVKGNGASGINVGGDAVITVSGNTIIGNGSYGILAQGNSQITNNRITGNGSGSNEDVFVNSSTTSNVSFNIFDSILGTAGAYNVKSDGTAW
jgi:hypothetical protein